MSLDQRSVTRPFRKLRKVLDRLPTQPPPGVVHDVRTQARQVDAALKALRLESRNNPQQLLPLLHRLRRRAGTVRDMDVLTEHASGLGPKGEPDCLVLLLEHLGAERENAAQKVHTTVRKYGGELRRRLKRCAVLIDKRLSAGGSPAGADDLDYAGGEVALKLVKKLQRAGHLDHSNLHLYRRQVKKLRYVLEVGKEPAQEPFIASLGEVKDAIGEWHDWEVLLDIARDVLKHSGQCELIRALYKIADTKYEHALTLTNKMRTTYLSPEAVRERFAKPVLAAA